MMILVGGAQNVFSFHKGGFAKIKWEALLFGIIDLPNYVQLKYKGNQLTVVHVIDSILKTFLQFNN